MTKTFNNGILYGFAFIVVIFSSVLIGCNKSDSSPALTKEQLLMKEKFSTLAETIGQVNINTVKSANKGDKNLYVITAEIKGSKTKKYVLKVDERVSGQVNFSKFLFDTNMPNDLKQKDYSTFNGYAEFYSLDNNITNIKVAFYNGEIADNPTVVNLISTTSLSTQVNSPLTDCIKREMGKFTFGGWVLFVATEPESVAALILACAIDVAMQ